MLDKGIVDDFEAIEALDDKMDCYIKMAQWFGITDFVSSCKFSGGYINSASIVVVVVFLTSHQCFFLCFVEIVVLSRYFLCFVFLLEIVIDNERFLKKSFFSPYFLKFFFSFHQGWKIFCKITNSRIIHSLYLFSLVKECGKPGRRLWVVIRRLENSAWHGGFTKWVSEVTTRILKDR
jgi:hypothetical protein